MTDTTIEDIRKRPGMFVGSTNIEAVYNLVFDLVETIVFKENNDFLEIKLIGSDIFQFSFNRPVNTEHGRNTLKIAEALSSGYDLSFKRNLTTITFQPDKAIFTYEIINYHWIYNRLRELALLNENIRFLLSDKENKNVIQFNDGLNIMLYENMYLFGMGCPPTNVKFTKNEIEVSLSMLLGHPTDVAMSYVNNSRTNGGGTHVQGLYDGVYYTFKKYIENNFNDVNIKFTKKDIVNDLNFIMSIKTNDPAYEGNTKRALADNNVRVAVKDGIIECLDKILALDRSFFDSSSIMRMAAFMNVFESSVKRNNSNINWDE